MFGSGRALLLQLAHPHVAAGVEEHSDFQSNPFKRLLGTLEAVYTMVYGTEDDAAGVGRRIRWIHDFVSGPAYQASKAGMLAFARGAGLEEQEHGVRFSTVLPGIVNTTILDNRPVPPDEKIRAHALAPEDVAEACLYIAAQPLRVSIPELTILPAALQTQGRTGVASPDVAEAFER